MMPRRLSQLLYSWGYNQIFQMWTIFCLLRAPGEAGPWICNVIGKLTTTFILYIA